MNPLKRLAAAVSQRVPNWRAWCWRLGIAAWLMILAGALVALYHEWSEFHFADLQAAAGRLGWKQLGLAVLCTLLSYIGNAGIDWFSLRWLKLKVPLFSALRSSMVAAAFSLNAGGTILGGSGVRVRLYGAMGVSLPDVAKMAGFAAFSAWSGNALVAGILLVLAPEILPFLPEGWGRILAILLPTSVVVSLAFNAWRRSRPGGESLFPPTRLLTGAVLMSALDWLMAGMALRVLLPDQLAGVSTAGFLGIVLFSQLLSAITHVPGGAGVLELSISKCVGPALPTVTLAAALLTYRLVFYLIPFGLALAWMSGREAWVHRKHLRRGAGTLTGWCRKSSQPGPDEGA